MVAWILADELMIKFGGDSLAELQRSLTTYQSRLLEL